MPETIFIPITDWSPNENTIGLYLEKNDRFIDFVPTFVEALTEVLSSLRPNYAGGMVDFLAENGYERILYLMYTSPTSDTTVTPKIDWDTNNGIIVMRVATPVDRESVSAHKNSLKFQILWSLAAVFVQFAGLPSNPQSYPAYFDTMGTDLTMKWSED